MAYSIRKYTGDGSTLVYPVDFSFGYLDKTHVRVYIGSDPTAPELEYTWVTPTMIRLAAPVPDGTKFTIRRITPRDIQLTSFASATHIKGQSIDAAIKQSLMILQELDDVTLHTVGGEYGDEHNKMFFQLDMMYNEIKNVSQLYVEDKLWIRGKDYLGQIDAALNAVLEARDAVISLEASAQAAVDEAAASALAADLAKQEAQTAQGWTNTYKDAAAYSAQVADAAAQNSLNYANASANSASISTANKDSAAADAAVCSAQASIAQTAKSEAETARNAAQTAQTSAEAAASNASASASAAASSASSAAGSATAAATSKDEAQAIVDGFIGGLPVATTEAVGVVEKATTAEATAATADKFPDAAGVKRYVDQFGIGNINSPKMGVNCGTFGNGGAVAWQPGNGSGAGFQARYTTNRRAQMFIDTTSKLFWRWTSSATAQDETTSWKQALAVGDSITAESATKLQTARTIGGVSFDGSANINLPGVNATGNQNTTGNAGTATKLATARTITLTGGASGSGSFDGSSNLSISVTVPASGHTHTAAEIGAATAGLAGGGRGSYVYARISTVNTGMIKHGGTYAGSQLYTSGVSVFISGDQNQAGVDTGSVLSGSWKAMGSCKANTGSRYASTLFLRVA